MLNIIFYGCTKEEKTSLTLIIKSNAKAHHSSKNFLWRKSLEKKKEKPG